MLQALRNGAPGAGTTHSGDDVRLGLGLLRPTAPRKTAEGEAVPPQGCGGRDAAGPEKQHCNEAGCREDEKQKQAPSWYPAAQAHRPEGDHCRLDLLRYHLVLWQQVAERAVGKRVLELKGRAAQWALWLASQTGLQAPAAKVVLAAGGDEGIEHHPKADGAGEHAVQAGGMLERVQHNIVRSLHVHCRYS